MNIKDKLSALPHKPGVYLHKDNNGNVIYVGKAIDLYKRVNSYFRGGHDYKTSKLVHEIRDFDFIVTASEKEALILEYNLIKEYDPKYNIVFKDDKSYPYILLSDSATPYVSIVRLKKRNRIKGKLYGPFPDVGAARNAVELINKLYPTRKCKNLQKEYCLYYHMGQCLGYCQNSVNQQQSLEIKEKISDFLNGNTNTIIKDLKNRMLQATNELKYEDAAYFRDLMYDIRQISDKQNVQKNNRESFDVFNYAVSDSYIAITGLFIKNGKIFSHDKHLDYLVSDAQNYVTSYIYQFYEVNNKPKKLYLPEDLMVYLKDVFDCYTSKRGYKYQLIKKAYNNCLEALNQNKNIITNKELYYDNLAKEFKRIFNKDINRIELFDNSHTAGKDTVGAMVVYKNFKTSKKDYRLYKLQEGSDDLASMKEMLYRRYFRLLKEKLALPDLIIVDGGRNQIMIAKEILNSLNLAIEIVGLGKDEHHNTSYLMDSSFNMISIKQDSNLFFFLAAMQDEVHRFAITYHKKLRGKSLYKSPLDDIKGLGDKGKIKLLKKYKSLKNIKEQTLEELQTVLNNDVALKLYNRLHDK